MEDKISKHHSDMLIMKHLTMNMIEDCFELCNNNNKKQNNQQMTSSTTINNSECLNLCYETYQRSYLHLQKTTILN
ncbi:hypothetical protein ABK040_002852 [Willaertia magna]